MGLWVGTSGYAYPEWRGSFYPEKMQTAKMLPYYAERFPTVEINNTFYRMPNAKLLEGWSAQVPEQFKLTLKAPQRITHQKRLRDCADDVKYFLEVASTLGPKLGAILFQTAAVPADEPGGARRVPGDAAGRAVRRVRVPPQVVDRGGRFQPVARPKVSRCVSQIAKVSPRRWKSPPAMHTSGCATKGTSPPTSSGWAQVIREKTAGCSEVFVYFKHEEAGIGTEFARQLIKNLSG